jgi:hypothetical protein
MAARAHGRGQKKKKKKKKNTFKKGYHPRVRGPRISEGQ